MRHRIAIASVLVVVASISAAPQAKSAGDLDRTMAEMEAVGHKTKWWTVPPDHGRFLRLMTEAVQAKRVLEIGTSNGYTSLWFARALRNTGGKLITIEIDERRAKEASANFAKAGVADIISLHNDDAFDVIPTLDGDFDVILIDAAKKEYKRFFEVSFPKLRPGGLLLAHNVITRGAEMKDFLATVQNHPQLITNVVQMGDDGFTVSLRMRPLVK